MSRSLLLTLVLLVSKLCFAQETRESLINDLAHKQPDTVRLRTLYHLGNFYFARNKQKHDLDSAELYLKRSLALCDSLKRARGTNLILCRLGEFYLANNKVELAKQYYNRAANFCHNKGNTEAEISDCLQAGNLFLDKDRVSQLNKRQELLNNAIAYFERAKVVLRNTKDTTVVLDQLYSITYAYYRTRHFDRCQKECLEQIKNYRATNLFGLDMVYTLLSAVHRWLGNYNKSLFYILEGIKRVNRINDTINRHHQYGELALVYDGLGQTDHSIEWYKKTLQLREKIPGLPQDFIFRTAGFIVQGLIKQGGNYKEGLRLIAGLEQRHPPENDRIRAAIAQVRAYCYDGLKKDQLAEKYYLMTIALYGPDQNADEMCILAHYDLAKFYTRQKKYDQAYSYIKGTRYYGLRTSQVRDFHLLLFKIDSSQGRLNSALKHFQQYKQLNDSIFNATKSKQIEELQIKYKTEQKENDLESITKDRQQQYENAQQATATRNITFIGIGLLLIIFGLLFNSYRINRKKTIEIDRKNRALNQLVTEKDDLLEEKEWLIKEVHHRVKNNLQIVMGLLQRQSTFVNNKEALTAIQNSEHRMHSIALIHQKLYQSDSFMLVNMADYIDEMIGYLRDSFDLGTRITFEKEVDDIELEINIAVPLGLILNEAITNAIKYAFPTHEKGCIQVGLNQTGNDSYVLHIADNGRGLPADFDMQKINSMGFNLVRGLSKQLGGKFNIVNQQGVTIVVDFKSDLHTKQ